MEPTRPDNLRKRGNEKGHTSGVVAQNARRLRGDRDLRSVSARLGEIGWPISVAALSRLENGDRRVDVDDLLALSVVLNASPIDFLFPADNKQAGPVATGMPADVNATEAKSWARGFAGLSHQDRIDYWADQKRLWENELRFAEERTPSASLDVRKMAETHLRRTRERLAEARLRLDELLALGGSVD